MQEESMLPAQQNAVVEQWFLLGVFFVLFAVYGFMKSSRGKDCKPCYHISFGILAIVFNSLMLFIGNRTGIDNFNLVQLLTLKQIILESSFIVFGYCLIIQGTTMLLKEWLTPASVRASRSYL
jgi:uncharacterized protein (DUF486 family)